MNQDQFLGILRALLPAGLAYVVGKGWVPAGAASDIGAAVVAIGTALWSYSTHTDSSKLAAAAALPDVKKIITVPNPVSQEVRQVATDSMQPKIAPDQP